ncbi:MAG: hypothetical protein V1492_00170 [Candidatus Micrarchaeota archaeon]
MKTCTRCGADMGVVSGGLDFLFHAFGSGLCEKCKRELRIRKYDKEHEAESEKSDDEMPDIPW